MSSLCGCNRTVTVSLKWALSTKIATTVFKTYRRKVCSHGMHENSTFICKTCSLFHLKSAVSLSRRLFVRQHAGMFLLCWSFVLLSDFAVQLRVESTSLPLFVRLFARRNLTSTKVGKILYCGCWLKSLQELKFCYKIGQKIRKFTWMLRTYLNLCKDGICSGWEIF
jgi:hypothetical protein